MSRERGQPDLGARLRDGLATRAPPLAGRPRGFTLLEVLIALAIALPALLLLYRQAAIALDLTGSSFATQQAISRAQSHLEALVDAALVPGDREGDDGGAYRWRTRVAPIASGPAPRDLPRRSAYAGGTTLYAVSVQISWRSARGPQQVVLETRRLGPSAADTP